MAAHRPALAAGQTASGDNVVWRVGANGMLRGTSDGPTVLVGPKPPALFYGRTAAGENIPILVDADGNVQITT